MPGQQQQPDKVDVAIKKFFFPTLITMVGFFLWAFYLKVDSIQTIVMVNQVDNAVFKEQIKHLQDEVEEIKKKIP